MPCYGPLVRSLSSSYIVELRIDPVLHMLGLASPWLETDSNDPKVAEISAKVSSIVGMADRQGFPTRDFQCKLLRLD
jgi:hypothetical protein